MNKSFIFCVTLFFVSQTIHAHNLFCNHDNQLQQKAYDSIKDSLRNLRQDGGDSNNRNLGAVATQPIRVTSDMTGLNSGSITQTQKTYLTSVSNTVMTFLQSFIKVQPNPVNNVYTSSSSTCIDMTVPTNDRTTGIPNSDLHLYFIYVSDPNQGFLANAGFCNLAQTPNYIRPNFGRVAFNIAKMLAQGTDQDKYQNDIMVTLHEIVHVLGFSGGAMQYWFNKSTQQIYGTTVTELLTTTDTFRGIPTTLLKSPNVLKVARKYYGCDTIAGMQIENQGGSGSIGSHWERTIIRSEVMTAAALIEGSNLTVFTTALLQDTGFWDEINENLTDPIYWGKGKGCDFFTKACQSTTKYQEFSVQNEKKCSFWNDGIGNSIIDPFGDQCYTIQSYSNELCEDVISKSGQDANLIKDTLSDFSYNSKCFHSTIVSPTPMYAWQTNNYRCHIYQCSPDRTQITLTFTNLPSFTLTCNISDQGNDIPVTYNGNSIGTLTCPDNYQKFCDNQNCKNFCTFNGVCIRGDCLCNPGYSGDDCSVACAKYYDGTNCVTTCPSNTFANPDNTCKSSCPKGYYKNNGVCSQCDFSCSDCSGPANSQCTACQYLTYLEGNKCVQICQTLNYVDEATKSCKPCPIGCNDCTSSMKCGTCKTGYTKSGDICTNNTCGAICATCTSGTTECLTCRSGTYLQNQTCVSTCDAGKFKNDSNGTCTSCSQGCSVCTSETICTSCISGSNYRKIGNSCSLCQTPCSTCLTDTTKCTACENNQYLLAYICYPTCPDGYYNSSNYQCAKCINGCSKCTTATTCDTCNVAGGFQPFTRDTKQICIQQTDCYTPCLTCSGTYKPTTCAKCVTGYFKQGDICKTACDDGFFADATGICQNCSNDCKTCKDKLDYCLTCADNKFANQGTCYSVCPTGLKGSQGICQVEVLLAKSPALTLNNSIIFALILLLSPIF